MSIPYVGQRWASIFHATMREALPADHTFLASKLFAHLPIEFAYKPSLTVFGLHRRSQSMQ